MQLNGLPGSAVAWFVSRPGLRMAVERAHRWLLQLRLASERYPSLRFIGARRYLDAGRDRAGKEMLRNALARYVVPALGAENAGATPPMGIVMVCGTLGSGGAERQLVNTALGLKGRGVKSIAILCQNLADGTNTFFAAQLREAGIDVVELGRTTWSSGASLAERLAWRASGIGQHGIGDVLAMARFFRERRPAVVHAWLDEVNVKAGLAAIAAGVPRIVLGGRSVAPWQFPIYRPYLRYGYQLLLAERAVTLLNNSEAGAADYLHWLARTDVPIRVLRNGLAADALLPPDTALATNWRQEIGLQPNARTVGGIMRFTEEKEPLLWVRTAAYVLATCPDVEFVLAGDGPLRHAAMRLAERLGLGDRVCFPGLLKQPELAIANMDVLLLTSRCEGLPNVVIEAQAMGVPAVVTNRGCSSEAVEEGLTGWSVEKLQPQALAERVVAVLEDDAWRIAARLRAPHFVREQFGLRRMLDETLDCYGFPDAGAES